MRKNRKKILAVFLIIIAVAAVVLLLNRKGTESFEEKYAGADLDTDVAGMERTGTYTGYLNEHADAVSPDQVVEIDLAEFEAEQGKEELKKDFEGEKQALYTDTGSLVTWKVQIPETGYYNLYAEYLIPESRGVAAERAVYLNGEIPFEDARDISFTRIWTGAIH